MSDFKNVFKILRTREGLTQEELSEKLDVARSAIGNWEQGTREPNYETLEVIADYFNVDMNYLLGCQSIEHRIDIQTMMIAEKINSNEALLNLFNSVKDASENQIKAITEFIKKLNQ